VLTTVAGTGRAQELPDPGEILTLEQGVFLLSAEATPPRGEGRAWEPVTLLDLWRETRPEADGTGWYRFELPGTRSEAERLAVYLPRLSSNASVFVNGEPIGQSGRMDEPVGQNWNRPLFFPFSRKLLSETDNRLEVRLYAHQGSFDRLGPILVGPAAALAPLYEQAYFFRITLSQLATGLGIALVLFMAVIWIGAHRDPVYGYFLVAGGAWVVASLNYHVRDVPFPYWPWQFVVHYTLDWVAIASVFLVHRLLGLQRPRFERVVVGYALLVAVVLALSSPFSFEPRAGLFHVVSLLLGLYAAVSVGVHYRRLPRADLLIFLIAATIFLGMCFHDLLAQLGVTSFDTPRVLQYGGPLILTAFAGCLTARFIRAYNRAENLNVELEERIQEKHAELEENFAKMRGLEHERVLAGERERMMREMHDGMGGQLVSALALVEGGEVGRDEIAGALRDSLADLRLVIHSLDPSGGELETVLALARERIEPRLQRQGLELEWRLGELPPLPPLSPEQALHIVRIVEEAVTNVLKHAGAHRLRVTTGLREDAAAAPGILLEIRDDGTGPSSAPGPVGHGHGMRNMRARAEALGASLRTELEPTGMVVELWLPLARLQGARPGVDPPLSLPS
jgi:signal transduction histidine kinase